MKKILMAEGEKAYRVLCKEALQAEGWEVSLAATGQEVLEKIREEHPDLVILDMRLPGGGVEVLGQIEQGGRGPAIILTARWRPCDEDFLAWRAEEWLVKSQDLGALKAAVRRALAARAAGGAPVPAIAAKRPPGASGCAVRPPRGMPVA